MPHLRTHATLYSVHKLVLPDIKNDFGSKKENAEELKIVTEDIINKMEVQLEDSSNHIGNTRGNGDQIVHHAGFDR